MGAASSSPSSEALRRSLVSAKNSTGFLARAFEEEEEKNPELLPPVKGRSSAQLRRFKALSDCHEHLSPLSPDTAPVIIAGLQRTGTTLLHALLAEHPRFVAPPLYRLIMVTQDIDDTEAEAKVAVSVAEMYKSAPILRTMHPMAANEPEECCHLFALCGIDRNAVIMAKGMNNYFDWLITLPIHHTTVLPDTLYLYSCLLRRAAQREGILLVKDILHMLFLDYTLQQFPNAVIVHTYRRPQEVLLSACDCYAALAQLHWPEINGKIKLQIGERISRLFKACLEHFCGTVERRNLLNSKQLIVVPYAELMRNPIEVAKKICGELSSDIEAHMQRRLERPRQSRNSTSALSDYGISEESIAKMFAQHSRMFNYDIATGAPRDTPKTT